MRYVYNSNDSLPLANDAEIQEGCLHDALERALPESMKGGAHMLVCNCPRCRTIC